MKTLAFISRRQDVTRDSFRDHYEGVHAPLALPLLDGLERYVRHHVREEVFGSVPFDCMTSFWWRDGAALGRLMHRLESAQAEPLRRDEQSFMDKSAEIFFPAEELGTPSQEVADQEVADLLVLVRRAPGGGREGFEKRFEDEDLAALGACGLRLACDQRGVAIGDREPLFDRVSLLAGYTGSDRVALEGWAGRLAARGDALTLTRVSEHESPIA